MTGRPMGCHTWIGSTGQLTDFMALVIWCPEFSYVPLVYYGKIHWNDLNEHNIYWLLILCIRCWFDTTNVTGYLPLNIVCTDKSHINFMEKHINKYRPLLSNRLLSLLVWKKLQKERLWPSNRSSIQKEYWSISKVSGVSLDHWDWSNFVLKNIGWSNWVATRFEWTIHHRCSKGWQSKMSYLTKVPLSFWDGSSIGLKSHSRDSRLDLRFKLQRLDLDLGVMNNLQYIYWLCIQKYTTPFLINVFSMLAGSNSWRKLHVAIHLQQLCYAYDLWLC